MAGPDEETEELEEIEHRLAHIAVRDGVVSLELEALARRRRELLARIDQATFIPMFLPVRRR